MSKQIQVSDEVWERLKNDADAHYRTIGGQIEYLQSLTDKPLSVALRSAGATNPSSFDGTKIENQPDLKRTSKDVLADIEDLKLEGKESVNQDPDYWIAWDERKQALWKEYKKLEGKES